MPSISATKRAAVAQPAATAAKKQARRAKEEPVGPWARHCQSVAAALGEASAPAEVLGMVGPMLEAALMPLKDERHGYQEQVLDMVDSLLASAERTRLEVLEAAKAAAASGQAQREVLRDAVGKARSRTDAAASAESSRKRALAERARGFQAAKQAHEEKELAQMMHEQQQKGDQAKLERLRVAERDQLTPLVEGVADEGRVKELIAALTPAVADLGLDASMLAALPNALSRGPAARGQFDKMVVQQVVHDFGDRTRVLDASLAQGPAATATVVAATGEAAAAMEVADSEQRAVADDFLAAQTEHRAATEEQQDLQQSLKAVAPKLQKLARDVAAAEQHLAAFRKGALASFAALRERTTPAPAPVATEAAGVETVTLEVTSTVVGPEAAMEEPAAPEGTAANQDAAHEGTNLAEVSAVLGTKIVEAGLEEPRFAGTSIAGA